MTRSSIQKKEGHTWWKRKEPEIGVVFLNLQTNLNPSESVNPPLASTPYERKASLYMKHNIEFSRHRTKQENVFMRKIIRSRLMAVSDNKVSR